MKEHIAAPVRNWIVLLAALHSEASGLLERFGEKEHFFIDDISGYTSHSYGKDVLLVQTGMGAEQANRAAERIVEQFPVALMISFGFAGGLAPYLKAGNIVLCEKVFSSNHSQAGKTISSDPGLLDAAYRLREKSPAVTLGNSLTVEKVLLRPEQKHALWTTYRLHIVEMESYWIGKVCAERRIPFLAVRVVSDLVNQRLPDISHLADASGDVRWAAVRHLLSHPGEWPILPAYFRNLILAQQRLTGYMEALIRNGLRERLPR